MAIVEMKCPNCGSVMQLKNGQFCCPSCRTMMLHIIDAKIDADVSVISPAEFQKKLEESKKSYVIKIEDKIKVFDAKTEIVNAKIQNASQALDEGKFDTIDALLSGVSSNILSAERLRLLAVCKVKSEADFIYGANIKLGKIHLENIFKLADPETRKTYQKIAEICENRYRNERRTEKKISDAAELINVGRLESAVIYSKQICNEDPTNPLVWLWTAMLATLQEESPQPAFVKMYQMLSLMDEQRYIEWIDRYYILLIQYIGMPKTEENTVLHSAPPDKPYYRNEEAKYNKIIRETKWREQVLIAMEKNGRYFYNRWRSFDNLVLKLPCRTGEKKEGQAFEQLAEMIGIGILHIIFSPIMLLVGIFDIVFWMIDKRKEKSIENHLPKEGLKQLIQNSNIYSPLAMRRYQWTHKDTGSGEDRYTYYESTSSICETTPPEDISSEFWDYLIE